MIKGYDYKYYKDAERRHEHYKSLSPIRSIENGVDSFELILNIRPALVEAEEYLIVKGIDTEWSGEHLLVSFNRKWKGWDSIVTHQFIPKCGWKNFKDTLNNSGLFTLPSQRQIKNFEDGLTDGTNYTLEIATRNTYRRISYHCPGHFHDSINESFWHSLLFIDRNVQLIFIERH